MFCECVETLWCIAALLQQVSHSLRKIKYKQLLYVTSITNKTIKYAQCKLLTFMCMSTDKIKLELKALELEGVDWIYVEQDRDQLLAFTNKKI